ncbi:MAG TPA: pyridoxal phosphate-dependent aminotransferase [Myxococcota bacterium]|nr:pyridoxal phosphate-dependent aminotransferase [Myxococcota bacterium]
MFSGRVPRDLRPNRLTAALEARRAAGGPVLDLSESNPTRVGLDYPARLLDALAAPGAATYEPAPTGLPAARAAVASYYAARGHPIDPAHLVLCASTSEAYAWLFKLLAEPGEEVLVPAPCYPLFSLLAGLESVRVAHYPLQYDGRWHVDTDALRAAVTPATRALVVVNPNNPTGSFLHAAELAAMEELCRAHDLAIVSDEVFADYADAGGAGAGADATRVPFAAAAARVLTFSLSGLSKVAALPQMKLGWIAAGGPEAARTAALARLEIVADTFLSVGAPVQHAAAALLAHAPALQRQIRARVAENRAALGAALRAAPAATLLHAEGGWYAVVRCPRTMSEEELCLALLAEDGVLVHPGYFFDFASESFLVLSLLPVPALFAEAAGRLAARIALL